MSDTRRTPEPHEPAGDPDVGSTPDTAPPAAERDPSRSSRSSRSMPAPEPEKPPSTVPPPPPWLEALYALSVRYGVPGLDLAQVAIPLQHLNLIPREIAERHGVLPVLVQDERIFLAMADPEDKRVIDELEFVTGKRVFPYVAEADALRRVIREAFELKLRGEEAYYLGPRVPEEVLSKLGLLPLDAWVTDRDGSDHPTDIGSASRPAAPSERPSGRRPSDPTIPHHPIHIEALSTGLRAARVDPDLAYGAPRARPAAQGDPDAPDASDGSDVSSVSSAPAAAPAGAHDGPLILVVDDEREIRRLLERVLVDRGYRVLEADRGTTALRMLKERAPDLIVLDAMLPEVHGFEICRRIRSSQKYASIPIVMISAVYRGWRYAEDVKKNYGVDAYIEKPFRLTDVLRAVESALAGRSGVASAADREKMSDEAERALRAGMAAYQAGDLDGAIDHLKRGATIDALAYRLHYHLGLLYGKKGQLYDAIQALETAVEINALHFSALKNLAVLYQRAGFKLKAIETWERALGPAPDDATRQGIRDHLRTLL